AGRGTGEEDNEPAHRQGPAARWAATRRARGDRRWPLARRPWRGGGRTARARGTGVAVWPHGQLTGAQLRLTSHLPSSSADTAELGKGALADPVCLLEVRGVLVDRPADRPAAAAALRGKVRVGHVVAVLAHAPRVLQQRVLGLRLILHGEALLQPLEVLPAGVAGLFQVGLARHRARGWLQ